MILRCAFILCFSLAWMASAQQLETVNAGVGDLSFRLLEKSVKGDENTVHSGYSIASAMGMCLLGAQGETHESIRSTMQLSSLNDEEIKAAFKVSSEQLLRDQGFTVRAANRLYVSKAFPIRSAYLNDVNEIFHADAHNVDFRENGKEVQQQVNSFVNNRTEGLIPQILNSLLPAETAIALVNALYFKGTWEHKMKDIFIERKFNAHTCDTSQSIVANQEAKWMRVQSNFRYTESATLQASLIELPYTGHKNANQKASMIIILPQEQHKCDISGWVKQYLKWSAIVDSVKSMDPLSVEFKMPHTEIEAAYELSEVLSELGMAPAFSNAANFNGMVEAGDANIKISKAFHKAKMIIDEKGTEAAAASVFVGVTKSMVYEPPPQKEMFVDRSFAAVIILRQSDGSIVPLFTSVVNKLK